MAPKPKQTSVRFDADLAVRVDRLVEKLGGLANQAQILRMALTEGLAVLEERFSSLPEPAPTPAPKKRRSQRT